MHWDFGLTRKKTKYRELISCMYSDKMCNGCFRRFFARVCVASVPRDVYL